MSGSINPLKINDRQTLLNRINKTLKPSNLRVTGENWDVIKVEAGPQKLEWLTQCQDRWGELRR